MNAVLDFDWFCASMLWSILGFLAGCGVGYLIYPILNRLTEEHPHDDT